MNKLVAVLLLGFCLSHSVAAQVIVLDIPSIPGESSVSGHEGEINVISWSQSVANVNNMAVVLPLTFNHEVDKASPKLVEAALMGNDLGTTTLTSIVQGVQTYENFVIELNGTRVVSVKSSGAMGAGMPIETVTLTCDSFEIRYREILQNGDLGPVISATGSCGN